MRELLGLEVNDIIVLDTKVDEDLKVRVGEVVKFLCAPGQLGKQRAAQITEPVLDSDSPWSEDTQ
jgi:flagellar motor switch protein FliM